MSFLRRHGGRETPPHAAEPVPADEWEPRQFARASGDGVEVRFHDAAEAKLATEQLRALLGDWQTAMVDLAAAHAEEMAKHAGIVNEMKERQARIELVVRQIDAAIAQVEAYTRRAR